MADRFNGAGDDFGDLEDDGDDYNVSLDGSPMPEGAVRDDDTDNAGNDNASGDDMFDDPVSEDSDAYDPNAILKTAEEDGDYSNDEFEPSRPPGMPPRDASGGRNQIQEPEPEAEQEPEPEPDPEPEQNDSQAQDSADEQMDFTNDGQASYADNQASYPDQQYQERQAFQPQAPAQWQQGEGFVQPAPEGQYQPQWVQQQYQQYQQYPPQGGYQQMGGPQDDGNGGYQQQPPAHTAQQYPQDDPGHGDAAPAPQQEDAIGQDAFMQPDDPVQDETSYAEPAEQDAGSAGDEGFSTGIQNNGNDDAIPSVTTEIPDSEMIAKIISLADNIRSDLSNEERGALRKILDVKEPDYGENNDEGKEDIMDSANMVFNALRMKKSILDAFDDLLSAQADNDSERAFFLIRQNDQDLRHIIEICRKFVNYSQKTDSSHLHISLAEIAAHCIAELSDDDVRLLQAARGTLELSREIIHG